VVYRPEADSALFATPFRLSGGKIPAPQVAFAGGLFLPRPS
jgi:hypothetical protein